MITTVGRPVVLAIEDATMVGEARRRATSLAESLGFDETTAGKVAIIVTEAASNLSKYAKNGEIVVQGLKSGDATGLDILALDRGPGMVDVARCMTDGFSTAGSQGHGLGAMSRMSSFFDIHSLVGTGTACLARFDANALAKKSWLEIGAVNIALAGEEVCGDSWAIEETANQAQVFVVDGLGHGLQAAEAARAAIEVFQQHAGSSPTEIIQRTHSALRSTRGAALAVAEIDRSRGEIRFAGVGNISGSIIGLGDGRSQSMVSHNGTVGHTIRKIQEFAYPWLPGSVLIMHSDGLGTQWQLSRYPGLVARHPALVAGTLYRDFRRIRDDATVVVVREESARHP